MHAQTHFRRDHFGAPANEGDRWQLKVMGEVVRPLELTLEELQDYPSYELPVVLECAGHRRAEFRPKTPGIPWKEGAVSEALWRGVRLQSVLDSSGIIGGRFVVLEGADAGSFDEADDDVPFARALPIARALHPDTLIAWEMNGGPLPVAHGAPLRAIVPGWYATDSVKWLRRIIVTQEVFMGPFEARDYRLRNLRRPVGDRLTVLPVHALLTSHREGQHVEAGEHVLSGVAWGGTGGIAEVAVSLESGRWQPAILAEPRSPYAFTRWHVCWTAHPGRWPLAIRATDAAGNTQPDAPEWNAGGYANSSVQRVHVIVD
jgi:DMSO/TMAO reductase YedYZ molybdopterin-dependent catalytic subunit